MKQESPYKEIIAKLNERRVEVEENDGKYKMKKGMSLIHQKDRGRDLNNWGIILPEDASNRNFVLTELHVIPHSLHHCV